MSAYPEIVRAIRALLDAIPPSERALVLEEAQEQEHAAPPAANQPDPSQVSYASDRPSAAGTVLDARKVGHSY